MNRASPVSGTLLVFCVNQGISASFSLLYFLSLADAVHPEGIPGSCWADPWTLVGRQDGEGKDQLEPVSSQCGSPSGEAGTV